MGIGRSILEFAAYGFAALVAAPCAVCLLACLFRCVGCSALWRQCRAVVLALLAVATIATIKAQKRGGTGTTGISPVASPVTNTLHISAISVPTSGTVRLTAAWPIDYLSADQTLDVLGKENLRDVQWTWITNGVVAVDATNISWVLEGQAPSNYFYKVVLRNSLTDMGDHDGDGIPNVYELHHGTNPWIADSTLVPKLTVGPSGSYATIADALASSAPYSVIEIVPGMYSGAGWGGIKLPEHPVLVTGLGRRPVIRSDSFATFLLPSNSTERTLVRNLSIDLGGRGGLRVGFWCGGNLPWNGQSASATFENIYVRMPDSDAQYYGWIFYRASTNRAVLSRCAVNASGASDALGVFAIDPPPLSVESCTFANFPSNTQGGRGAALLLETSGQNFGCVSNDVDVTITRSVFDDSFTNALPLVRFEEGTNFIVRMEDCVMPRALESPHLPDFSSSLWITNGQTAWSGHALADSLVANLGLGALPSLVNDPSVDSDDNGICDYEEIYDHGTDPFLVDSDNDGVPDGVEIGDGTDPTNPHSFTQTLTVTVTNTASTALAVYTAWGYSASGWEANDQETFPNGFGATNYINASSQGATHVKAYCDLNENGEYDAASDILLVRAIPQGSTAQINFTFGDVDGDGVSDTQERAEGTDPYDGGNFRLIVTVNVESSDVAPGLTNYVAWGYLPVGWESNDIASFTGSTLAFPVVGVSTNGELFVKVFRDFNANGIFDEGIDALVTSRLTRMNNGKTVTFKIGDSDGDGISDSIEMGEGTDPFSKLSYCFSLSLTYTGVFQTTNALTFAASFGTNRVYGPCVVEGNVWTNDFGHRATAAGERVSVDVWDDMNQNGEWDSGETSNKYVIAVTSHDMVVTNKLSYKNFDRNNNELPDWWEAQEGLDSEGVARRMYDDPDSDGLINLHEFWCGTHPLVPDGSNTLLSVASRSIDDRIRDIDPLASIYRFFNFFPNGSNGVFQLNANFWARDLDLSCVSVWHNGNDKGTKAATLITRKHVVLAQHWWNYGNGYTFCDTNGNVYVRFLSRSEKISDDLRLGQLNEPLPDSFRPASVMSTNYVRYLSSGKYLPTLCLNQKKAATVLELENLNCRALELGGIWHSQYGQNTMTNYVSMQRNVIRGATPGGDSGSPVFLVVGNELVLLFSKHLGSLTEDRWYWFWGPMLSFRLESIQDKINEWEGSDAGQYQIVPFDLSVFPEIVNQR